jgi:hypothetical protein
MDSSMCFFFRSSAAIFVALAAWAAARAATKAE